MHNRAIYNNAIAQLGLIQIYRFPNFSTFQTFAVNLQIFDLPRFTSILEKTMQIADLLFSGINFSTFQLFNFSTLQLFNLPLVSHFSLLITHLSPLSSLLSLLIPFNHVRNIAAGRASILSSSCLICRSLLRTKPCNNGLSRIPGSL